MPLISVSNNALSNITAIPASIPTGALTLIKSITASASASISFVDGTDGVVLDGTYLSYVFKFIDIHPANDGVNFTFQGSTDGGSNYNVTLTSTAFQAYHAENDSGTSLAYGSDKDQAQGTSFQVIMQPIGNESDESGSGTLQIFNPSSLVFVKHFIGNTNYYNDGNYSQTLFTAGYFNTTSAINAVQFKFSSGNIDDGIIKLYGVK